MIDWYYVIIPESRPVGRCHCGSYVLSLLCLSLSLPKKALNFFLHTNAIDCTAPVVQFKVSRPLNSKRRTRPISRIATTFFFGANDDARSIFLTEYRPGIKKSVTLQHGQESENDVQSRDGKDKPIIHPN